jgi:tetratricopeptide (TPR) repeat protein
LGCGIFPVTLSASRSSPSSDTQALLYSAKRDLDEGQAQKVIDTLKPHLDQFVEIDEKATAYEYLGQAESQLGHFQFAAMYFEKVYALQPTAEHLYNLATAYDAGGDLKRALKNYQALSQFNTADSKLYRSVAEQRITELLAVLTPISNSIP